ncbi:hypothetical protein [Membranihabitans marinus]|uniref:hypothetical protein n=1 Tax=Membranihabitans marinus TaxID=1227546 RepID=UPI001F380B71|nr:hypothetical protein [Membranihabitans marinus]
MELILSRSFDMFNVFGSYSVLVNGVEKGKLYYNKLLSLKTEEDWVKIVIKMYWAESKEFRVNSTDRVNPQYLNVSVNPWYSYSLAISLSLILLWYLTDVEVFRYLSVLPVMVMLYFYSFGRKNFFKIDLK